MTKPTGSVFALALFLGAIVALALGGPLGGMATAIGAELMVSGDSPVNIRSPKDAPLADPSRIERGSLVLP